MKYRLPASTNRKPDSKPNSPRTAEFLEVPSIFPEVGFIFGLIAYVAVALGGFGSIVGALFASLLIGLVEALGGLFFNPAYKYAIIFAMYLGVVLVRPKGLFGRF